MLLLGVLSEKFARNELLLDKLAQARCVWLMGLLYCRIQLHLRDRHPIDKCHDTRWQVCRSRLCRNVKGSAQTKSARCDEGQRGVFFHD
jgi:hypothetical protein